MTSLLNISALATEMKGAQDEVRQIEPFTSRLASFDLPAAYEVARRVHRARLAEGFVPVGRKIGFTNRDMWACYGVGRPVSHPIWAHVYEQTVVHLPAGRPTRCRIGRFAEPKVEPEIVFRFHSAPPAGGSLAAILACVDWVAHGFEIVQSHFPGWKFQAPDTVADGSLHGTLLVGEPRTPAELGADVEAVLRSFTLTLSCNGESREVGRGSNVLGSPLAAVAYFVAALAEQLWAAPLQAGEIVTTGTLTTARSILPGQAWETQLAGIALPGLRVEFVD